MSRPRKLTSDQVRKIQADWKRSRGQRGMIAYLARKYDVSRGTIHNALESPTRSVKNPPKVPGHKVENQRNERSLVPDTPESENDGLSGGEAPDESDGCECATEGNTFGYWGPGYRHAQWCPRRRS